MAIDVIEIFCSYSHKDEALKKELETHLSGMKRQGLITLWSDRQIDPGTGWKEEIDSHLESAEVILLLISADFIASDYCYEKEMMRALERHMKGEARTIPIILREVDWKAMPFSKLQALPTDGKAITTWKNRDKAFADVARGIRQVVEQFRNDRSKRQLPEMGYLKLTFEGTVDEVNRPQVENILSNLRSYVGNAHLQLERIETGSVVCIFYGSREGFEKIQAKFHSEELIELAGLEITNIQQIVTEGSLERVENSLIRAFIARMKQKKITESNKIRVLIVEDHAIVRQSLRRFLQEQNDIQVVGDTGFGEEGVRFVQDLAPDVVLLDLSLDTSHIDGIATLIQMIASSPSTHVVILTVLTDEATVFPAIYAGAIGYVPKISPPKEILEAIRDAAWGRYHIDPWITKKIIERIGKEANSPEGSVEDLLTQRERELLPFITQGLGNQEIAGKLSISAATVKTHVSNILRKLVITDESHVPIVLSQRKHRTARVSK